MFTLCEYHSNLVDDIDLVINRTIHGQRVLTHPG